MEKEVQDGFPFEEAGLFRERVEHFGAGGVSGCIADLVAVGNSDGHASIF